MDDSLKNFSCSTILVKLVSFLPVSFLRTEFAKNCQEYFWDMLCESSDMKNSQECQTCGFLIFSGDSGVLPIFMFFLNDCRAWAEYDGLEFWHGLQGALLQSTLKYCQNITLQPNKYYKGRHHHFAWWGKGHIVKSLLKCLAPSIYPHSNC